MTVTKNPRKIPEDQRYTHCDVRTNLLVRLTPEERAERAKQAASLSGDVAKLESEAKASAAAYREALKKLRERQMAAAHAHNSGHEHQDVDCVQHFDLKTRKTWFIYRETEYSRRSMYDHELRETTGRLFKDEPPQVDGVIAKEKAKTAKGQNGDELAKQAAEPEKVKKEKARKPTKPDPKLLVQNAPPADNVTPITKASGDDVRDVINQETKRGGKKDHTT